MDKKSDTPIKADILETVLSTTSFAIATLGFLLIVFYAPSSLKFFKIVFAVLFSFLTIQLFKFIKILFGLDKASNKDGMKKINVSIAILLKGLPSAIYIAFFIVVFFACLIFFPDNYGFWVGIVVIIISVIGYSKLFKIPIWKKKNKK
jgi:hypothetical protein